MRISATVIDAAATAQPSPNWGRREWAAEFKALHALGVDTVILARAGLRDRALFPSRVLQRNFAMLPAYDDLVALLLDETERYRMNFFFGLYDSGRYWLEGLADREDELARDLAYEVMERYGDRRAFQGWSLPYGLDVHREPLLELSAGLARYLKTLKPAPVLTVDPRLAAWERDPAAPSGDTEALWLRAGEILAGSVDIIAGSDCGVSGAALCSCLQRQHQWAHRHGLHYWLQAALQAPAAPGWPVDWGHLRHRLETADAAGVGKVAGLETRLFMSPAGLTPPAAALHRRYREWLDTTH